MMDDVIDAFATIFCYRPLQPVFIAKHDDFFRFAAARVLKDAIDVRASA